MHIGQNGIDGSRKNAIRVCKEERLFAKDRIVLQRTAIPGTGVRTPSKKNTRERPGRNGDGNFRGTDGVSPGKRWQA
ncbi:MAG: hypothetical protein LUQ31_06080 [Methanoregula sp.]|nr:hypothetical protein [Methanoregula sp.]